MSEHPLFFEDWAGLGRVSVLSLLAYTCFVVFIRLSGARTLAKMNVFDFVFIVALGSTLSTTALDSKVTLTKGLTAAAVLILLQVLISWLTTKNHKLECIINGEPRLLFFKGRFLDQPMKRERVTKEEIRAAIRQEGFGPIDAVHAVVLETDGSFSIVWHETERSDDTLCDVLGQEEAKRGENR